MVYMLTCFTILKPHVMTLLFAKLIYNGYIRPLFFLSHVVSTIFNSDLPMIVLVANHLTNVELMRLSYSLPK